MNKLSSLLVAAFCAFITISCMENPVPPQPPMPNLKASYTANTFSTGSLHLATKAGWSQDSEYVKKYLNRLIAAGKDPGFKQQNAISLPLDDEQLLTIDNATAQLMRNGQQQSYKQQLVNFGNQTILGLTHTQSLVYYANQQHPAIGKLGLFTPFHYDEEMAEESSGYDYKITTRPELYASMANEMLYFPQLVYHLKVHNGSDSTGVIENFGNQNVYEYLATGDTLLVQPYDIVFK